MHKLDVFLSNKLKNGFILVLMLAITIISIDV